MREKRGIDKLADLYKEMNLIVMKIIYFDRVIKTEAEMLEDDVYNHIFDGFVNEDKGFRQRNPSQEFTAYISGEKIFTAYTIDRIRMFKEVHLGCCLSNSPFNQAVIAGDGVIIIKRNWEKSIHNRKDLEVLGYRVYSE